MASIQQLLLARGTSGGPPPAVDPYFANVVALLHMNGADGSTTWTDVTGKTFTGAGSAEIDTARFKYGAASGLFTVSGRVATAIDTDFAFGTDDFTIEWWQYWDSLSPFQNAFSMGYNSVGGIFLQNNNSGRYSLYTNTGSPALILTEPTSVTGAVWTHYAVVRQSGVGRLYRNGVEQANATMTAPITGAQAFTIAGEPSGLYGVRGNLDDFRVTKGICRYPNGTTFTPPTEAFPDTGPSILFAAWNPNGLPPNCTVSNNNLTATSTARGARTILANASMPALGYFECSFAPDGDEVAIGLATASALRTNYLGSDTQGYGYYLPGNDVYRGGSRIYNGATIATTPVTVGHAFNSATGELWIRRPDSTWEGGGDPVAGTSPTLTLAAGTYFPACTPYTGASAVTLNTGATPFTLWTPSGGFTGIPQ